ncbi:hypothetical protein [Crocinitomix catalasitica]|uniref:hypothetical protein n=1 Tax=Crocinitomix catalasitica TaxID=184607 RepID=UPI0004887813|nr:hypothetical protein [Crocinitomix catalasitica]
MKAKLIGVLAIVSGCITLYFIIALMFQGIDFKASYLKSLIFSTTGLIIFSGAYLLANNKTDISKTQQNLTLGFGLAIILFSFLISFEFLPFTTSYNLLFSAGILYILIVQLNLLNWTKKGLSFTKICAFLVLIADAFLILFFIANWTAAEFRIWINVAVLVSIFVFLIGILLSKPIKDVQL